MGCSFERQKDPAITNAFQNILDKTNHEPKKICVDKGSEFYKDHWNHACKTMV